MKKILILISILIFPFFVAHSFTLDEKLSNHKMEERAVSLFKIIKCLVCAGESLYESQSQLAYDMRALIREKINKGYSDSEIISSLRFSYGNQIMSTPPFRISTYILWLLPVLIVFIGIITILKNS